VLLSDANRDGVYEGTYGAFSERGLYRLVVYAQDDGGNQALPQPVSVRVPQTLYLPLLLRASH
jgi:hypothetical protein